MAEFGLILEHPLSKEILSKLLSGTSPKDINQWLRLKYPEKDQSHLRLPQKLLKDFKNSQFTDYLPQFQQDLAEMESNRGSDNPKYISAALTNIKPYRERMKELADIRFDALLTLEKNVGIILTRFEQMYDLMQQNPTDIKFDNTLIKYFTAFKDALATIEKMKLNSTDHLTQHNFTVQMMQNYINIIQDVVRDTMAKLDPDLASQFMEDLYNRLDDIEEPQSLTPEQQLAAAQKLDAQVVKVVNSNDS